MQKAYKFRLYPSQRQKQRLFNTFKVCKQIYNELLEMSISTYKSEGKTLHKFDYNKYLTGKYPMVHSQVKQNVSDRVHKAFQNFFRRVKDKSCKRKGFPRFKSKVKSIIYPQSGFKFISDKRLYASKIGNIPIVLHRTPRGKLKTMTIKVNQAGQWFAIFSCEVDMLLHKRQFSCPSCGLVCHRDHNAAINILQVGRDSPEFTPVNDCVRPSIFCGLRSMKQELHETNS